MELASSDAMAARFALPVLEALFSFGGSTPFPFLKEKRKWGRNPFFLRIEKDKNGGANFVFLFLNMNKNRVHEKHFIHAYSKIRFRTASAACSRMAARSPVRCNSCEKEKPSMSIPI